MGAWLIAIWLWAVHCDVEMTLSGIHTSKDISIFLISDIEPLLDEDLHVSRVNNHLNCELTYGMVTEQCPLISHKIISCNLCRL